VEKPDETSLAFNSAPRVAPRLQLSDNRIEQLLNEIGDLKRSVRSLGRMSHTVNADSSSCYAELVGQGIDEQLAGRLVANAGRGNPSPSELRERVRRELAKLLIVEPPAEFAARSRVVSVFVGPTGAGKTTTIAKLA